jgi:hypothetical protein
LHSRRNKTWKKASECTLKQKALLGWSRIARQNAKALNFCQNRVLPDQLRRCFSALRTVTEFKYGLKQQQQAFFARKIAPRLKSAHLAKWKNALITSHRDQDFSIEAYNFNHLNTLRKAFSSL